MPGIGEKILSGILAEMGDIDRFDDVREIQKLSGMGLALIMSFISLAVRSRRSTLTVK